MTEEYAVAGYREYPIVFSVRADELYGIVAEPTARRKPMGVILVTGSGHDSMMQRNRMWTHLARRLATQGFAVLRFDYHGLGESTGDVPERAWWLDRPFTEDLAGAADWMRRQGITQLAMVGHCYGARTILASAENLPELRAAVLLATPLRAHRWRESVAVRFAEQLTIRQYLSRAGRIRVLRRLFDPFWRKRYFQIFAVKVRMVFGARVGRLSGRAVHESPPWISARFLDAMRRLSARRVPLLFLYGADEEFYGEFRQAARGELGGILTRAGGVIEVRTVPGVLHGFTTTQSQRWANDATVEWVTRAASLDVIHHEVAVATGTGGED